MSKLVVPRTRKKNIEMTTAVTSSKESEEKIVSAVYEANTLLRQAREQGLVNGTRSKKWASNFFITVTVFHSGMTTKFPYGFSIGMVLIDSGSLVNLI